MHARVAEVSDQTRTETKLSNKLTGRYHQRSGRVCCFAQIAYGIPGIFVSEVTVVTHFCNHCENFENPVTPASGISVPCPVGVGAHIDVHLHHECAEAWSKDFNIPLPMGQTNAIAAD
jgi:hypothetical protein